MVKTIEKQNLFSYVRYNAASVKVLHDLTFVLKTQNHRRPVIFKMANHLKYNEDDILNN